MAAAAVASVAKVATVDTVPAMSARKAGGARAKAGDSPGQGGHSTARKNPGDRIFAGRIAKVPNQTRVALRMDDIKRSVRAGLEEALEGGAVNAAFEAIEKHLAACGPDSCQNEIDAAGGDSTVMKRHADNWKPSKAKLLRVACAALLEHGNTVLADGQTLVLKAPTGIMKWSTRRVVEHIATNEAVSASDELSAEQRSDHKKRSAALSCMVNDLQRFVRIWVEANHADQAKECKLATHFSADSLWSWNGTRGAGLCFTEEGLPLVHRALHVAKERADAAVALKAKE